MNTMKAPMEKTSALARAGQTALKFLSLFVILEPIWMLLPFAGFLYGSVMHIQTLAQNPATAWLTHFVFPVLTLGVVGPILVAVGFVLFLIGAGQIYWAKLRRSGLVTNGLYRYVQHPQYIALTLFGLGILLTWGRAITFLAFFVMMFLYYYLAKSESRACARLFGEEYERYREKTSFIIPGDRHLRPLAAKLPTLNLPAPVRVAGAFVLALAVCFASMWTINTVKTTGRTVPHLATTVALEASAQDTPTVLPAMTAHKAAGVPFVQDGRVAVVRGPYRNAWQAGFAERVATRLRDSDTLKDFLAFLDEPNGDVAVVFCGPYEKPDQPGTPGMHAGDDKAGHRGPPPDPAGPERVRLIIMRCRPAPNATIADAFADKSKRRIIGACIASVNIGRATGEDIVEGKVTRPGPRFPGEERWDHLLRQLSAAANVAAHRDVGVVVPGDADSATVVMAKAPILRTRLDPAFAQEILDRLTASATFRHQLQQSGVGGDVVAVAFPTPGPNWYKEYHHEPEVSVCVMLVRRPEGTQPHDVFSSNGPGPMLGAFFADMDFEKAFSEESITAIRPIGPRRDLRERWDFFLSGV